MAKERINFFELSEEKPSLLLTYRLFTLDDLEMAIVEELAIVKGFAGTIVPAKSPRRLYSRNIGNDAWAEKSWWRRIK